MRWGASEEAVRLQQVMIIPAIVPAANPQQARCPVCGQEFAPPAVVVAIPERSQKSELSCRDLPASAFADPRLLSACPHCQHPLQFNPFFAAADDYAEVLRRGLDQSRCEKGADHEETLAYLAALAVHLESIGKSAKAAEFQREHDALSAQLPAKKNAPTD